MAPKFDLIGRGVYTVAEGARIIRVPERRLHRWTQGYVVRFGGRARRLPPAIAGGRRVHGQPVLNFLDIQEARFLDAFIEAGCKWATIHMASRRAQQIIGHSHPFSNQRFFTDGRNILMEVTNGVADRHLLDLVRDQIEFDRIVTPFLRAGIEYASDGAPRIWRPMPGRSVVVDPARAFGAPIVEREGVPTAILAKAVAVNGSVEEVAWWYETAPDSVRDAVAFETEFARAA